MVSDMILTRKRKSKRFCRNTN